MDHTGHLRDARTGKPLDDDGEDNAEVDATATPGDESAFLKQNRADFSGRIWFL